MNPITEKRYQATPDVLFQEVAGEMVLLDLKGESYFGLNEVGTRVWLMLEARKSVPEILDALHAEYEVEKAELETDVAELLDQLLEAGLIRPAEGR